MSQCGSCLMQPLQFFVSWQGVLTLAYRCVDCHTYRCSPGPAPTGICRGFPKPLAQLKEHLNLLEALPRENPGSRWPKTTIGCLRDGKRLDPQQLKTLTRLCRQGLCAAPTLHWPSVHALSCHCLQTRSSLSHARRRDWAEHMDLPQQLVMVDSADVVLYSNRCAAQGLQQMRLCRPCCAFSCHLCVQIWLDRTEHRPVSSGCMLCRCLEQVLSKQHICFCGTPECTIAAQEVDRVATVCWVADRTQANAYPETAQAKVMNEMDSPDYWYDVSKDGNRETHYRGVAQLLMETVVSKAEQVLRLCCTGAHVGATLVCQLNQAAVPVEGLLQAIHAFCAAVDGELPSMYTWFRDDSLHITVRALSG